MIKLSDITDEKIKELKDKWEENNILPKKSLDKNKKNHIINIYGYTKVAEE